MTFDPIDRATWGDLLTRVEVAAILRRGPEGVRKDCTNRTMVPAPAFPHPWRWRKSEVIAFIDGTPARLRRAS